MLDHLLDSNPGLRNNLRDQDGLSDRDILFVKELIAGPIDPGSGLPDGKTTYTGNEEVWPFRGRDEDKSFLYEIVANKINGENVCLPFSAPKMFHLKLA